DGLAAEAARGIVASRSAADGLSIRASGLRELAGPIASRVVRAAVLSLGVVPEAGHVEAVRSLAEGRPGRSTHLPGGLVARRERAYVRLSRAGGSGADAG